MYSKKFDRLVAELSQESLLHPRWYQLKVGLLALLGYGYVIAIIILLVFISVFSVFWAGRYASYIVFKVVFGCGGLLFLTLKAMWVKLPVPEGIAISSIEAPELFFIIERLRSQLKVPKLYKVFITEQLNAGVCQIPRLGLLGWYRPYLLIGLPLIKALSAPQLEAVLAHELGHLAGRHGVLSNWIYRLRLGWDRLIEGLEKKASWGNMVFLPFFRWYVPFFSAYSFPLARANEFYADKISAQLTSTQIVGESLIRVEMIGRYLNECYWREVFKSSYEQPLPTVLPYSGMRLESLKNIVESSQLEIWLTDVLKHTTDSIDTHPSFSDRLKALQQSLPSGLPSIESNAEALLGASLKKLTQQLDNEWQRSISLTWKKWHEEAQAGKRRLAEILNEFEHQAICDEEIELSLADIEMRLEYVKLLELYGEGEKAARVALQALFKQVPESAWVNFAWGQQLLRSNDQAGVAMIVRAMALDEKLILVGAQNLCDYFYKQHQLLEVAYWQEKWLLRRSIILAREQEREYLHINDRLLKPDLAESKAAQLTDGLKKIAYINNVYLTQKPLEHDIGESLFVLGYTVKGWPWNSKKHTKDIEQQIFSELTFFDEILLVNLSVNSRAFRKKFLKDSVCLL
ncbi:MAG: M48 family metallopeptidase [Pseudomonadota bacterium]